VTAITKKHIEWAVVDRLRAMLAEGHPEFGVTHAFSMFQAILCWVCQRTKDLGETEADRQVRSLVKALQKERIEDAPWSIYTTARIVPFEPQRAYQFGPFHEFERMKVDRFFRLLRNATAHGDSRRVEPVNEIASSTPERKLLGYRFHCWEEAKKEDRIERTWSGTIILLESDMRRLGVGLADRFCTQLVRTGSSSPYLPEEARHYVTETRTEAA
jgi:hypothetical protein